MIDYAPVEARTKGEVPTAIHEGAEAEVKSMNTSAYYQ
jgi:hypothetical protein